MKRAIQLTVQGVFYMASISVALLVIASPSIITGPF